MSPPTPKAELAELFNLLTSARSPSLTSDGDSSMNCHADPTQISNKRFSQQIQQREVETTRQRRNTVAFILAKEDSSIDFLADANMSDEDTADLESLVDFSRADAKKYSFAFKLPIYKLYKKADWAKTVRETLEQSKNNFKPMAEQVVYAGAKVDQENEAPVGKDDGAVRFKLPSGPLPAHMRRGSVVASARQCTGSISTNPTSPQSPCASIPAQRLAYPKSPSVYDRPEVRALKKRCVGRRKSMTVLQEANQERKPLGTWVYNAAVSASERPAPANFSSFPPAPPSSPMGMSAGNKYGMLGVKNGPGVLKGAGGHKRRVSEGGVGMMGSTPTMMPLGQVTGKDRLVARRRPAALDFEDEGCEVIERKYVKQASIF